MGHVPVRGTSTLMFVFFICFEFLFVYMDVRLSVHGQNYGGCSFSPKTLKMTCQFWVAPVWFLCFHACAQPKLLIVERRLSHKMNDKITFISMNCNGLNDPAKRRDVLNFLKSKRFSIYFLQETHFTKKKEENYIRSQWGFECYYNSFSSQQKGVAILINNNFEFKYVGMQLDNDGSLLILYIFIGEKQLTLINVYGPNRDTPDFYKNLLNKLSTCDNPVVMAGDFIILF